VEHSAYYWIASVALGGMVICIEYFRRRYSLISGIIIVFLIFHPTWTVSPSYGPDCVFVNVEAFSACAGSNLSAVGISDLSTPTLEN
jgi:hypothetical protein